MPHYVRQPQAFGYVSIDEHNDMLTEDYMVSISRYAKSKLPDMHFAGIYVDNRPPKSKVTERKNFYTCDRPEATKLLKALCYEDILVIDGLKSMAWNNHFDVFNFLEVVMRRGVSIHCVDESLVIHPSQDSGNLIVALSNATFLAEKRNNSFFFSKKSGSVKKQSTVAKRLTKQKVLQYLRQHVPNHQAFTSELLYLAIMSMTAHARHSISSRDTFQRSDLANELKGLERSRFIKVVRQIKIRGKVQNVYVRRFNFRLSGRKSLRTSWSKWSTFFYDANDPRRWGRFWYVNDYEAVLWNPVTEQKVKLKLGTQRRGRGPFGTAIHELFLAGKLEEYRRLNSADECVAVVGGTSRD